MFLTIIISLLCCCLVMTVVWLWAVKIKNAGVVDIFWAFNFALIALITYLSSTGSTIQKTTICSMVILWSCRLGLHLLKRIGQHLEIEEGRYRQLRKEWAPKANKKFFYFFQMQAISNVLLSIPFFIAAQNSNPNMLFIQKLGIVIWVIAFIGESIADWQLTEFKKGEKNKGMVCEVGLWNYSRHPNYFFEWLVWVGYFLFTCTTALGLISIICPLIMLYLIFKVTGIPLTEEQSIRSKGDAYKHYQQTTSVFVPWFKKKR